MTVQQEPAVADTIKIGDRSESIWSIACEVFILCEYDPEESLGMVEADGGFTAHQVHAFARAFDLLATTRNKES